jgi:predicted thioesterase
MVLRTGLTGEVSITVTDDLTAAAMIALLEAAAIEALKFQLADGQTSVGTSLNVKHLAVTPVGMEVRTKQRIE